MYTKPEITLLNSAVNAIQQGAKGDFAIPDSPLPTNAAYEADE